MHHTKMGRVIGVHHPIWLLTSDNILVHQGTLVQMKVKLSCSYISVVGTLGAPSVQCGLLLLATVIIQTIEECA